MSGYVTNSNTLGLFKFNNASDPYKNSIVGHDGLLESLKAYYETTPSIPNYGTITNEKYFSRTRSFQLYHNEAEVKFSPLAINCYYSGGINPNGLKFDNIEVLAGSGYKSIITQNEWTVDFWLYPNIISSENVGHCPFLKLILGTGLSYEINFMETYARSKSTSTTDYKWVFAIKNLTIFYSDNIKTIYNQYITNAANTKFYLSFNVMKYKANTSSSSVKAGNYLIPLEINNNDWNHIALINSISKGPLIAINGKITQLIKDYNPNVDFSLMINNTNNKIYLGSTPYYDSGSLAGFSQSVARLQRPTNGLTIITVTGSNTIHDLNGNGFSETLVEQDVVQSFTNKSYIDDVRVSQAALWTEDFTPPGIIGKQIIIYDEYAYYFDQNTNNMEKLSFAKWNDITEADKLILLNKVWYNVLPDISDIKLLQSDPSKDIICLNYQEDTITPTLNMQKIDESRTEVVYPNKFMDYGAVQNYIENITANGTTSTTANIRLAITRNGVDYFTYNNTNSAWVPLDNKEDVVTDGILLDSLKFIPKASWIQFDLTKFAFSIALTKTYDTDPCQISDIKLKLNLDEKWVKANKETQVKYKYVGPTLLKITFLEDGKYKINYNDRG